jgi:hypothetical protein
LGEIGKFECNFIGKIQNFNFLIEKNGNKTKPHKPTPLRAVTQGE